MSDGWLSTHPGTLRGLQAMVEFLPERPVVWSVGLFGGNLLKLVTPTAEMGGHISIGLGDYPYLELGSPTNAEVVAEVVRMCRAVGREPATPDDVAVRVAVAVTVVVAPAKLTVSLRMVGVRDDGYHLIDAEMVTLDVVDTLFVGEGDGLEIVDEASGEGLPVDADDDNLVRRGAAHRRARAVARPARPPVGRRPPVGHSTMSTSTRRLSLTAAALITVRSAWAVRPPRPMTCP